MVKKKSGRSKKQKNKGPNSPAFSGKSQDSPAISENLIGHGNRLLKGMREICQYVGFSESTILGWIRDANFPARKTSNGAGTWVATTKKVDKWKEVFFA